MELQLKYKVTIDLDIGDSTGINPELDEDYEIDYDQEFMYLLKSGVYNFYKNIPKDMVKVTIEKEN